MSLSSIDIENKLSNMPLEKLYKYTCETSVKTNDGENSIYYSEIAAAYVLKKIKNIKSIIENNEWKITPSEGLSYFSVYRTNITKAALEDDGKPHFGEEDEKIICRDMYIKSKQGESFEEIGKVIDFETPLAHLKEIDKEQYRTRKVGNVDLISCSLEKEPTIWLLEVKNRVNDESMYRCVMEGFTYLQTIDKERYIKDLNQHTTEFGTISEGIRFRTAPLIAYNGNQYKEMEEAHENPKLHENLLELMRALDVTVYFSYQIDGESYVIKKHSID